MFTTMFFNSFCEITVNTKIIANRTTSHDPIGLEPSVLRIGP